MATIIRPELSEKNKYRIDKHRYYELKHFCLQYKTWKRTYAALNELKVSSSIFDRIPSGNVRSDLTAKYAIRKAYYEEKIKMIERAAMETDDDLGVYILKAVTCGYSYTQMRTIFEIPCSRDTYYNRYRKFFWLLNEYRN